MKKYILPLITTLFCSYLAITTLWAETSIDVTHTTCFPGGQSIQHEGCTTIDHGSTPEHTGCTSIDGHSGLRSGC